MQTGKRLRTTTRFCFRLPLSTAHKVHPVGQVATIGHFIHFMDATTKYAIPLIFVCVHTNVGYKIVAKSLYQNEDNECVAEALNIIKSWNPT